LSNRMAELQAVPAFVDRIEFIKSRNRTKADFFERFTKQIKCDDTDFDTLITQAYSVRQQLLSTGLFNSVKMTIDTTEMYEHKTENGYQIIYEVDEKLVHLNTSANLDPQSGNPDTSFKVGFPNLLGRGEQLKLEIGREFMQYERATSVLPNVSASFQKMCHNQKTSITAAILHRYHEKDWSNVTEENLTGELRVAHGVGEYWRMAGAVKSRLINLLGLSDKDIPLELREQFGYAKKHSIELEATRDTTKDYLSTVVPLGGAISRMAHEFWHNGCKTTLSFAYFKTLREGLTAKLELQSGVVKARGSLHHSDKFFLGGQNNLRGFEVNSYGPRDSGCAMGGEAMVHVGGHLYSSLQFISDVLGGVLNRVVSPSFALHAFATAGNVNSMENILKDKAGLASSFGVGVVCAIVSGLNFEVNCVKTSQDAKFKFNSGFNVSM